MYNFRKIKENKLINSISKSFVLKMIGAILSFIIIPVSINVLDGERYGIWTTILTFVSWFTFFDFGLGNGLRNKLSEVIAKNEYDEANKYLSTGYAVVGLLITIIIIILLNIYPLIKWSAIFNTTSINSVELMYSMIFISIFFLINLLLSNINSIFYAFQKPELTSLSNILMQAIFIIIIIIFKESIKNNLILFSFIYGLCLVLSNLVLSLWFFITNNKIRISFKNIKRRYIKGIMDLGVKFFLIQLSSLVLLSTDNIVITQILGPQYVTEYNIVYKLFSIVTMIHGGIILNSLWSTYTKAYAEKNYNWIISTFSKTKKLFFVIFLGIICLMVISKTVISIWIGKELLISNTLIVLMSIYTIMCAWTGTYCSILNGLGKINLQLAISIFSGIINIPLSVMFAKYIVGGIEGVILGTVVSLIPGVVLLPIQVRRVTEEMKKLCLEN